VPRSSSRDRLLDSAERLFARHGVEGVSLRGINADAGLSPAALHYHFGSKDKLVEALLDRRMSHLMVRRTELLDALIASPEPASVRDVMRVLITPLCELLSEEGDNGHRYLRLLARLRADGDLDDRFVSSRYPSGVARLDPLLQRALPTLSVRLVRLRLALAVDLLLRSLAEWEALAATGEEEPMSLDTLVESLLDFVTGGFEAHGPDTLHRRSTTAAVTAGAPAND
jgi:AcrR family transcriptional regulator